ncbi:MAG: hypothetical protein QXS54_04835 [Candidatus Methanomethylicaceae archaeon]
MEKKIAEVLTRFPDKRDDLIAELRQRALTEKDRKIISRALTLLKQIDDDLQQWITIQCRRQDIPPANFFALLTFAEMLPEEREALVGEYIAKKAEVINQLSLTDEQREQAMRDFAIAAGYFIAELSLLKEQQGEVEGEVEGGE